MPVSPPHTPNAPRRRPVTVFAAAALACGVVLVAAGGCSSSKSTVSAQVSDSEPTTLDRLVAAITGKPVADPQRPLTTQEGRKLIEQIRANPAKLERLSPRERYFLAKAVYGMDEDDF